MSNIFSMMYYTDGLDIRSFKMSGIRPDINFSVWQNIWLKHPTFLDMTMKHFLRNIKERSKFKILSYSSLRCTPGVYILQNTMVGGGGKNGQQGK